MTDLESKLKLLSSSQYQKELSALSVNELHFVVSKLLMAEISESWKNSRTAHEKSRRAYYFSSEFLVGRAIYNNLFCLNMHEELEKILLPLGQSLNRLEEIQDAALGNGGLGRLAACFLDSAATLDLPVDGYGIRYKYGLFKQKIENGFQKEEPDDWTKYGDPWSVRREDEAVTVTLCQRNVKAVPYDMPIIGYKTDHVSTIRLWQCEAENEFDFTLFNDQKYAKAVESKNEAEDISRVLYPNDSTKEGRLLRLKQEYFFSYASLKDIIRTFKKNHGNLMNLYKFTAIQLNDTHPVISIPALMHILKKEGMSGEEAFMQCCKIFSYTNHTVMSEALERWNLQEIEEVSPETAKEIENIDKRLKAVTAAFPEEKRKKLDIIQNGTVNMAYLACFVSSYINGVAQIHTEILKNDVLKSQYEMYGEKFQNKTNGITPRRWIGLCNKGLSGLITSLLETDSWLTDLTKLEKLRPYAEDENVLYKFYQIKMQNKAELCKYVKLHDGIELDPNTIFDVQIKRLHEYKRQLLNILVILSLYLDIKDGSLTDFKPTTFIFAAKSAPGYFRAKAIIKLISEVSKLIASDEKASKYIKVVFLSNYNVSYAEKIVAAAEVSEQISTAGTEASGTGNMKLMLNGAVTIGTYDGANIEIVKESGEENNFIFGKRVEEIEKYKNTYDPKKLYESNRDVKRTLDCLIDGTLDDGGTGMFKDLYNSLLGSKTEKGDRYFLLLDFDDCKKTKLKLNACEKNDKEFYKKCFLNTCGAGKFSSDRTVSQYAKDIWHIEKVK